MSEPAPPRSSGREILALLIIVIVGLVILGIIWRVVRAILWLLAALLLAFLIWIAYREKQKTGSWAAGVSASGRVAGRMARGVGRTASRVFRGRGGRGGSGAAGTGSSGRPY
ncbi:MAG: hypothetical protein Q4G64_08420 [bacterium]|nr:hypothetical protein [bacterium]